MIYNSLRKLPKIIQAEILETGDLNLLNPDNEEIEISELAEIWDSLQEQFNEKYNKKESSKVFNVYREIEYLDKKYLIIKQAVEALRFDISNELISLLKEYGYRFRIENYIEDLERIERESEGIIIKINQFIDKLPNIDNDKEESEQTMIIDNMAAYTSILGYDFDFYSISVEKYHALEPIIKNKIDAIQKQNNPKKK